MKRRVGGRLRGQSGFVILNKIAAGVQVSVGVLTDNHGGLRRHNVGKLSGGQQVVLLSLVIPQVGGVSGQGPTVGIQRSRTVVTVELKTFVHSLQVLIVGNRLGGCQGCLCGSGCRLSWNTNKLNIL